MEINYYLDHNLKNVVIIDLWDFFIVISDFAPWIAKNTEDYDYINASWLVMNKKYTPDYDSKLLNNNIMFKETIESSQPFFNRKIISTLFG